LSEAEEWRFLGEVLLLRENSTKENNFYKRNMNCPGIEPSQHHMLSMIALNLREANTKIALDMFIS
jgi:hypothetical protein